MASAFSCSWIYPFVVPFLTLSGHFLCVLNSVHKCTSCIAFIMKRNIRWCSWFDGKKMHRTCLAVRPCLRVLLLLISKSSMAKKCTTNDKVNDSPAKLLSILIPKCNTNRNELFKQKQQKKNQHNTHHFFALLMNEHQEWMKPSQYTFYRLRVCVTCMQSIFFPSFSIVNVRGKCTSIDFMCFNWLNVCWFFSFHFVCLKSVLFDFQPILCA